MKGLFIVKGANLSMIKLINQKKIWKLPKISIKFDRCWKMLNIGFIKKIYKLRKKGKRAIQYYLITNHFCPTSFHYPPNYVFLFKYRRNRLLFESFIKLPV